MEIYNRPFNYFANDFSKIPEDENKQVNVVKEDMSDSQECSIDKKEKSEEGDFYDIGITVKQHEISQADTSPGGVQFQSQFFTGCCNYSFGLTQCTGKCSC